MKDVRYTESIVYPIRAIGCKVALNMEVLCMSPEKEVKGTCDPEAAREERKEEEIKGTDGKNNRRTERDQQSLLSSPAAKDCREARHFDSVPSTRCPPRRLHTRKYSLFTTN
jgi:hypothetical protein